jgi:plastocyanin
MRSRVGLGTLLLVGAACGGGSSSPTGVASNPPPQPSVVSVAMDNYSFAPAALTIKAGTAVRWSNDGTTPHTATSDTGVSPGFDSGSVGPGGPDGYGGMTAGGTFKTTFTTPGTYRYHCTFHGTTQGMTGTITVTP